MNTIDKELNLLLENSPEFLRDVVTVDVLGTISNAKLLDGFDWEDPTTPEDYTEIYQDMLDCDIQGVKDAVKIGEELYKLAVKKIKDGKFAAQYTTDRANEFISHLKTRRKEVYLLSLIHRLNNFEGIDPDSINELMKFPIFLDLATALWQGGEIEAHEAGKTCGVTLEEIRERIQKNQKHHPAHNTAQVFMDNLLGSKGILEARFNWDGVVIDWTAYKDSESEERGVGIRKDVFLAQF